MANYVNNRQMFDAFVSFKKAIKTAKKNKKKRPRVPEYLGECFLLIAQRLATRPNFANYTFKDEMIGDGVENCMLYFGNFNTRKSKNPFAYFTQIIYNAFIRRIQKERKQLYIKHKTALNSMVFDTLTDYNEGDKASPHEGVNYVNTNNEKMKKLVVDFEADLVKKRKQMKLRRMKKKK